MTDIIATARICIEARKRSVASWRVPADVQREVLRFIDDAALGKVNRGKQLSERRQAKYLVALRPALEFFNKATVNLEEQDIECFEKALSTNRIKQRRNASDYSHSTKADIRKVLRIYLRWRRGPAEAVRLAGWLDTRPREKTPDFLREQEIEKLFRKCRTTSQRYLIAVLFDSGARAAEFLNIRLEDIHLPEGKENFVKLTLRQEFSKTKGRTISLYWSQSLGAVQEYLNERIQQGIKSGEPVFTADYGALRMFLHRLGARVLRKRVHPHLFRSSSATFYATKLNRQELCYRYGWKFSSNMPDLYISRAGMENKELDEKFTATELSLLKDELAKKEQADTIKDDRIRQLESTVTTMQRHFQTIAKQLALHPSTGDVDAALERRRAARLHSASA